jgi:hypothetical protein
MSRDFRTSFQRSLVTRFPLVILFIFVAAGCKRVLPVDTVPLDNVGMNFDSIQHLKALKISTAEVPEIAKVKQAGMPDSDCVQLLQVFRSGGVPFNAGDAVAGLLQVGISEDTIFELAKINQLGIGFGELQAMHLAGLSDDIILVVAHDHAFGMPVLSGASLAGLKNTGLRGSTLLALAQRGIPDSQAEAIIVARRHGASDAEILHRFTGS